ncbi:hypothetical protein ACWGCI_35635 [Streptomyces sp. NPDC054949]|uniref:hypothetical protein n=1 Tax=unclassified Streptomyces TaxID=2593676 RepID=UPI000AFE05FD|nr:MULTISPECIES: hypothetical protein [unclassified Streptomyces]MCX5155880.1 hypothetical protein [Streptomyces sp. NBC_00291]
MSLMEFLKQALIALLITSAGWIGSTLLLYLMSFGHIKTLHLLLRVRRSLAHVPAGSVFHCRSGEVTVTRYDPTVDEDVTLSFVRFSWPTLLRWKPGTGKSKARFHRRLRGELFWRTALLVLVTVPLFGGVLWLTLTSDPLWGYLLVFLVAHQTLLAVISRVFFFKFWALGMVTTYLFLHKVSLWHPSPEVAAPLFCGFMLLSMGLLAVIFRQERKTAV